jgi:hypothetical protein
MSGSVNKVILVDDYVAGMSLPEISAKHGVAYSTVRYHVKKAGKLRTRADGVRVAAKAGKLGSGMRGKCRTFTPRHCARISHAMRQRGEQFAKGISVKPSGYVEYTRGPHKGRSVHVVAMEQRIGRRLREDECVHHIDGDRSNNSENNLALVTRSGHTRLHRRERKIAKG